MMVLESFQNYYHCKICMTRVTLVCIIRVPKNVDEVGVNYYEISFWVAIVFQTERFAPVYLV